MHPTQRQQLRQDDDVSASITVQLKPQRPDPTRRALHIRPVPSPHHSPLPLRFFPPNLACCPSPCPAPPRGSLPLPARAPPIRRVPALRPSIDAIRLAGYRPAPARAADRGLGSPDSGAADERDLARRRSL